MTAMLGMYDMPALQPANDRFWTLIRDHLGLGPPRLTRDRDFWEIWQDPDLVFAQTCGMPYRTKLHDTVQLVGTPDYGLPGCPPGYYRSIFVARAKDNRPLSELVRGCFAYNEPLSQSGWSAPITHLSELGLSPDTLLQTGAHAASAQAVASGQADLASLDLLTWLLLREHTDLGEALREVELTTPTPALPYITSNTRDAAQLNSALGKAVSDLALQDRSALHLRGLVDIPAEHYLRVPTPPSPQALLHKS